MTSSEKPDCADFLVATIRHLRQENPRSEATKSGIRISRLYNIASEVYSDEEIRSGLNRLLESGAIIATWRTMHYDTSNHYGPCKIQRVTAVTANMPLHDPNRWYRDMDGNFYEFGSNSSDLENDSFIEFKVYVSGDGLPKSVSRLEKHRIAARATATQIMEALQKT